MILRRFFLYLLSFGFIHIADWMNPNSYGPLSLNNYQLSLMLFRPFHFFLSLLFLILASLILYRMVQLEGACLFHPERAGTVKRITSLLFMGLSAFIIFDLVQNHLLFSLSFVSLLFLLEIGKMFYIARKTKKSAILHHFQS